jgi:hypothetical protein
MVRVQLNRVAATVAALVMSVTAGVAQSLPESTPIPNLWGTNGEVRAMARVGDTLFVGGDFTVVGPLSAGFAIADAADASVVTTPLEAGALGGNISDRSGGWYVVYTAPNLDATILHLDAGGRRHPEWVPPTFDGTAVPALLEAGRLFVLGSFKTVNGTGHPHLAALDPTTGAVVAWTPTLPSGGALTQMPHTIASTGGRLYLPDASGLIAVDAISGALLPFSTAAPHNLIHPFYLAAANGRVFVHHTSCGPQSARGGVCAFDANGQLLWSWTAGWPEVPGPVWAFGDRVYVFVEGDPRLMALDAATGVPLPWTARIGRVWSVFDDGSRVYAGPTNSGQSGSIVIPRCSNGDQSSAAMCGQSPPPVAAWPSVARFALPAVSSSEISRPSTSEPASRSLGHRPPRRRSMR